VTGTGRGVCGYAWPMAKRSTKAKGPREVELKPEERPKGLTAPPPPRRLGEIVGQDRAVGALRSALASKRIHHAWIFHGPAGVGKFTTALAFAAVVLDPTSSAGLMGGDIEPDPDSVVQRLLGAGTHPDLHIITKELATVSRDATVRASKQRNIAKDVLEEFLIDPATRTGGGGGASLASKVFIIDEAELVDARGQNSLLKTLEEPAPGSVIILVTPSEERLLPTIRSRCQRVGFSPLSERDMEAWLKGSGLDISGLDAPSRQWLLTYAEGSPGLAHLALTTGIVEWHRTLAPMLAEVDRGRFPLDLGPTMAKLADEWSQGWIDRPGNENASKEAANRAASRQMFRLVGGHYRRRLRETGGETAAAAIGLIGEAERQAETNVQATFVMEHLAAQLALVHGGG
jgi:DNA polymerase III subunit delta'